MDKKEKRSKIVFSKDETDILKWLFIKTLVPVGIIIFISSMILFFGLQFLMKKATFGNYGLAPAVMAQSVSQFISTYLFIAVANILLMLLLSIVAIYVTLRNIVLPLLRITRELKHSIATKTRITVGVRKHDMLLIPLVEQVNSLIKGPY